MSGARPSAARSPPMLRVTLLCHAATEAVRAGRFPERDEPIDPRGEAELRRVLFRPGSLHRCWTSPARCAVATAAGLGLAATPEPLLDDVGAGVWAGQTIADLATTDPTGVQAWLDAPDFAAPGGESFSSVVARVGHWLGARQDGPGVVAVTHAAVIRAAVLLALGAPRSAARHIDIVPLSLTRLSGRPGHWRLAQLNVPLRRVRD